MEEKLVRQANVWFYEEALQYCEGAVNTLFQEKRNADKFNKKFARAIRKTEGVPRITHQQIESDKELKAIAAKVVFQEAALSYKQNHAVEFQAKIDNAKVIKIDPATLESLMNFEPEDYSYINNSQLPFPHMFFDSQQGVNIAEETDQEIRIHGLYFGEVDPTKVFGGLKRAYETYTFQKRADGLLVNHITFDPTSKDVFYVEMCDCPGFVTTINVRKGTSRTPAAPLFTERIKSRRFREAMLAQEQNMPSLNLVLENNVIGSFIRTANLCVNLVNYINAENITIIKREGTPKQKRKKRKTTQREYYVVDITSKELIRYTNPQTHWTLTERIYVRGHNRRYRDSDGRIYRVTWIPPHIKGQPDAPFRNQRYRYLAKQLELENRLFQEQTQSNLGCSQHQEKK